MAGKTTENLTLVGIVGCLGVVCLSLCVTLGGGVLYLSRRGVFTPSPEAAAPTSPEAPAAPTFPLPQAPDPDPTTGFPPKPPPVVVPVPVPVPVGPVLRTARVVTVGGSLEGRVTSSCELEVTPPVDDRGFCRAMIRCDGLVLYGVDASHGFFPCRIGDGRVSGADTQTTADDGDASLVVDTDARSLVLRDDANGPHGAYSLEATY